MKRYLIIDASNILYSTFFAHIKESIDVNVGMCHHMTLSKMNKYFVSTKADEVVLAFDDYSWRKAYTKDLSRCVTYKKYKGTRRSNMTPSDKAKMEEFDSHIKEFIDMFKERTSVIVLHRKYLEADDLIAGFIRMHPEDEHILLSSDKDFMQLLVRNNLKIIDPMTDKERSLEEFNNDPDYFIFEKCIRGDRGDNVMSAYPRIRTTAIKAAYTDPVARANIMQHTFTTLVNNEDGTVEEAEFITQDVYEENVLLMDLTAQPEYIRELMEETINEAIEKRGVFNYLEFLRFCGKYELNAIRERVDSYIPMLSCKRKGA